jgi:hypothetical protein
MNLFTHSPSPLFVSSSLLVSETHMIKLKSQNSMLYGIYNSKGPITNSLHHTYYIYSYSEYLIDKIKREINTDIF